MLNDKQKRFFSIMVLVALILCNVCTYILWQEATKNLEVVKLNAVSELVECGCEGYWKGVPFVFHQRDLDNVDFNFLGGKS